MRVRSRPMAWHAFPRDVAAWWRRTCSVVRSEVDSRRIGGSSSANQRKKSSVKRLWEVFCCCCGWCPDLGFLLRLALVCPDYRGRAAAGT